MSTNFKVREFACKDGSDPIFIDSDLVSVLQKIRNHFGKPVTITSAYRTPPHKVAEYAGTLLDKGGIGIYNTFTHIDVRTEKSRWQG